MARDVQDHQCIESPVKTSSGAYKRIGKCRAGRTADGDDRMQE